MIVNDDPGANDASNLTNYMSKEGHSLKNPAGNEMDETELNEFIRKSDEYGFTRHFVLAPERDDLREEDLDRAARKSMNEWAEDKDTLEYCYAVHNDEDNNHVHVAATASKDSGDLWIEQQEEDNEISRLRDDIAADHFNDHTTEQQQEMMIEQGREEELQQEQQERLLLDGSDSQQEEQEQDSHIDDAAIYAAAAGELASLTSPETLPISIAAEAYEERRRQREQQQQQNHRRER
jgi:hypothetical protein